MSAETERRTNEDFGKTVNDSEKTEGRSKWTCRGLEETEKLGNNSSCKQRNN